MGGSAGIRSGTSNGQRGAALVEMALLLPLLVMLLLGIVSAGVAYNHQLSLTHSAREAGRYAATLPTDSFADMNAWLDSVAARAVAEATGSLDPGTPGLYVCVAYVHPSGSTSLDSTASRIDDAGTVTYGTGPCFADGRPPEERRVQVQVRRNTDFNALVFQNTITLGSEAVNRFEAKVGL